MDSSAEVQGQELERYRSYLRLLARLQLAPHLRGGSIIFCFRRSHFARYCR